MPGTCPSGSSPAASRPTRSSASCCCCGTSSLGRCSRSTSDDFSLLNRVLDAYEPAANRIANTVAVSFVEERERVIRQQQDAIRELSTPGAAGARAAAHPADHRRARQPAGPPADRTAAARHPHPSSQGRRHRHHRCPDVDTTVANHLVQTVDASRLMGASVIITGLSPTIAHTLVTLGVDLSKMNTIGDLQGGIEEAERLLGFHVTRKDGADEHVSSGPALVSILRQGDFLIASVHTALDDTELLRFQRRPRRPDRPVPGSRGHHRRRRPGRARLVRLQHAPRHRRDGPTTGRGNGHRRHPAGRRARHGAARYGDRAGLHRTGS